MNDYLYHKWWALLVVLGISAVFLLGSEFFLELSVKSEK